MEEINDLIRSRRENLNFLKEAGVDPYPYRFEKTIELAKVLSRAEELLVNQEEFKIGGRIISLRRHGKSSFAHLLDQTGKIQIYLRQDVLGEQYKIFKKFDLGDIIGVRGNLFRTRTGELTVAVKEVVLLAKSLRPLPEKWHGLKDKELRYRQRYVDLIVNPAVRKIFSLRSRIIRLLRDFLHEKGFLEVETPMMQPLPGGAEARPFITHHHSLNRNFYLRIAPELYLKRIMVGGFEKIYEINRNFRNEGMDKLHNPEFTMLELYQAYVDYGEIMNLAEELIISVVSALHSQLEIEYQGEKINFSPPWERISMTEAVRKYTGLEVKPDNLNQIIQEKELEVERITPGYVLQELFEKYVEEKLVNPTIVYDFPVETSPLAKQKRGNSQLAERFEVIVGRMELCNAFSELNDPLEQRKRMEEQVKQAKGEETVKMVDEDYLRALEYGLPPAGGLGIGVDRLVMLLTNSASIREVIFFPQMREEKK